MMKFTVLAVATTAALTLSSGAFAQAYVGGAVGQSHYSVECSDPAILSCDRNDTGFKLFGGYKFTPNWAVEMNYFDFGKAKATSNLGGGVTETDTVKSTGVGLGVAFFAPMSPNWTFVGRLGAARIKTKVEATAGAATFSDSDTHTKAYGGIGVSYVMSKNLSVDGALDFTKGEYSKVLGGANVSDKGNIRLISVGLTYTF